MIKEVGGGIAANASILVLSLASVGSILGGHNTGIGAPGVLTTREILHEMPAQPNLRELVMFWC